LKFLPALHGLAPVQAANEVPESMPDMGANASSIDQIVCLLRGKLHPAQ
jgi:hypothetical protein